MTTTCGLAWVASEDARGRCVVHVVDVFDDGGGRLWCVVAGMQRTWHGLVHARFLDVMQDVANWQTAHDVRVVTLRRNGNTARA